MTEPRIVRTNLTNQPLVDRSIVMTTISNARTKNAFTRVLFAMEKMIVGMHQTNILNMVVANLSLLLVLQVHLEFLDHDELG